MSETTQRDWTQIERIGNRRSNATVAALVTVALAAIIVLGGCSSTSGAFRSVGETATSTTDQPEQVTTQTSGQQAADAPAPEAPITKVPAPRSATPTYQRFKAADAITAFQGAGLELGAVRPMTPDDYGLAPLVAVDGQRFLLPSLGEDAGGRAMSFATPSDLARTKNYYDSLAKGSAILFSWTFTHGNLLVQINGELPEAQARQDDAALQSLA